MAGRVGVIKDKMLDLDMQELLLFYTINLPFNPISSSTPPFFIPTLIQNIKKLFIGIHDLFSICLTLEKFLVW